MKKLNIIKGLTALMLLTAIVPAMTSCKEDYLEEAPVTSLSAESIGASIEGARAAKVGLCQGMYRQISYLNIGDSDRFNGEGWVMTFYGNVFGQAVLSNMYCGNSTSQLYADWTQLMDESRWGPSQMWRYCYQLINWANMILENIDNLPPSGGERDFIKAVALTIRAHSYTHLIQCYAPNWENADNGEVYCCVLRDTSTVEEKPFSQMKDIVSFIYSDLDTAISLYEECGWNREYLWEPNADVARGIYSRIAMIVHDYETARTMAHDARQNYRLMTADEYKSGFILANDEYLWTNFFELPMTSIYRYASGLMNACNGRSTNSSTRACNAIDYELYKKFPLTDIRKGLYLTPEFVDLYPDIVKDKSCQILASDFWNSKYTYTNGMRIQVNNYNTYMANFIIKFGAQEYERISAANGYSGTDLWFYPYRSAGDDGTPGDLSGQVTFGAQFKFWSVSIYCEDQWPWMRAAELAYTEAEAACRLGYDAEAQQIMNELNKDIRDSDYNCTATGDELLEEIKNYRTFELWGEGHNWFDLKRWHDPIERTAWVAGDQTSGNHASGYTQSFQPDEYYGWRIPVPTVEFNYNKQALRSVLPGGNR